MPATKAAMVPWGLGLEKDNISHDCDIKLNILMDNKLYIVQKTKVLQTVKTLLFQCSRRVLTGQKSSQLVMDCTLQ